MSYGEGLNPSASNNGFSIMQPTVKLPLNKLLNNIHMADSPNIWPSYSISTDKAPQQDYTTHSVPAPICAPTWAPAPTLYMTLPTQK